MKFHFIYTLEKIINYFIFSTIKKYIYRLILFYKPIFSLSFKAIPSREKQCKNSNPNFSFTTRKIQFALEIKREKKKKKIRENVFFQN